MFIGSLFDFLDWIKLGKFENFVECEFETLRFWGFSNWVGNEFNHGYRISPRMKWKMSNFLG